MHFLPCLLWFCVRKLLAYHHFQLPIRPAHMHMRRRSSFSRAVTLMSGLGIYTLCKSFNRTLKLCHRVSQEHMVMHLVAQKWRCIGCMHLMTVRHNCAQSCTLYVHLHMQAWATVNEMNAFPRTHWRVLHASVLKFAHVSRDRFLTCMIENKTRQKTMFFFSLFTVHDAGTTVYWMKWRTVVNHSRLVGCLVITCLTQT